ncbi:uncharacterized protein LOC111012091 isoform X2 [Momordica charantia]|uniref:Uncharacterized protein LOC111012091 isoform X2 n=1 Tax=Momordica charantia TaxID=3673 RepID=A0A6J1CKD7_MOMCH|nr:uncharacterized protein LOC111012091 isoform X2 [Momordica charantia]
MEALWNLEDKLRLSTKQALILFTFAAAAVAGLCATAWVKKRGRRRSGWARWGGGGGGGGETPVRLLGGEEELGFGSRNSTAAVWQRPILMGEKCEMLKYSGLILYDQRGRLLHDSIAATAMEGAHKEGEAIVVKTRLKDLL